MGQIGKARIVINALDSIIERMNQKVERSYRQVKGLELLVAGRIRYLVKDSMFLKSKRTSMLADEKVKIDGESIHLG